MDHNVARDWELNRLRMELVTTQEKWMKAVAALTRCENELAEARQKQKELISATQSAAQTAMMAIERLERGIAVVQAAHNICVADPERTTQEDGERLGLALRNALHLYYAGQPS